MKQIPFVSFVAACLLLLAAACSRVGLETPTPAAGGGGAATTSGQGGGEAGAPPASTRFVLGFVSDVPESIWVDETDSAYGSFWLSILRDGVSIRKTRACESCACDDCPNCPVCGAPCPTATEIASGDEVEWLWDGFEHPMESCPSSPGVSCQAEVAAAAGSYVARFCWSLTFTGTPPCPAEVGEVECADVPFVHPDSDGVVEHLVDHGG